MTVAWGRNLKLGGVYDAYLAEMTRARPSGSIFWRVESTQVETDVLRTGVHEFQGGRKKAHVTGTGAREFRRRGQRRRDADDLAAARLGRRGRRPVDRLRRARVAFTVLRQPPVVVPGVPARAAAVDAPDDGHDYDPARRPGP